MYASGLCIFRRIGANCRSRGFLTGPDSQFPIPYSPFRRHLPAPQPLHARSRPVDLKFRGHVHFFGMAVVFPCRGPIWWASGASASGSPGKIPTFPTNTRRSTHGR
jgi:hypothetical protein